ncbi:acyl-CoA dehydrogenase [Nocardioides limicola]|uniref:acyl-CoA dehydrogenase n=1 Tax=Nocardioides limicola TaxID=2803368 RepID=UPI00193B5B8C|nr:acyl-CoA dehydrogenase [Nocardioides sp. DJM-14]
MSSESHPTLTETAAAVREVAVEALERDASWQDLADAGLLALPVPTQLGGEGLGLAEVSMLLREAGRRAVDLPIGATLITGVLPVVACGTAEQQARLLDGVAEGRTRLTAALREVRPTTFDGAAVTGAKTGVVDAADATAILVTATGPDGPVVVVVDPRGPGIELVASPTSSGAREHTVHLDGAPAEQLGDAEAVPLLTAHHGAAICTLGAGLVAGATRLTADYIGEREQFGRRLAEFQAVAQQIADAFIISRTLDLAADNLVWRLGHQVPTADDLAVASYWFAAQAPVALHTCHHLHGGVGVDDTYPLHRYYSMVKDLGRALGGAAATAQAVQIEDPASKNLELTEAQRELKARLRDYFTGLVSPAEHHEIAKDRHGPAYKQMVRQMGKDGQMGVGWPVQYGGQGFGEVEQTIFANEAQRADVHLPSVTLQTVGPTLQVHGTEEQKERFLGPILAGEVHFAIGYSEPDAGTDLASLRTSARLVQDPDGDYYLVNGQKMWTTGGHAADYVWLAVRTDPEAPKHRGISILIVDTTDPGFSSTPIITCDGAHHVNATYYHDVKVPVSMRVGEENAGWRLITTQLNHERVMLGPAGRIEGLRDRVAAWSEAVGVRTRPDVLAALGEATAVMRVNELLNWEVARAAAAGAMSVADASASKVFASEQVQRIGRLLADVVHRYGDLADPATGELAAYLDGQAKRNLVLTFGGGVNEVQRELIAQFGLGLPRVPR